MCDQAPSLCADDATKQHFFFFTYSAYSPPKAEFWISRVACLTFYTLIQNPIHRSKECDCFKDIRFVSSLIQAARLFMHPIDSADGSTCAHIHEPLGWVGSLLQACLSDFENFKQKMADREGTMQKAAKQQLQVLTTKNEDLAKNMSNALAEIRDLHSRTEASELQSRLELQRVRVNWSQTIEFLLLHYSFGHWNVLVCVFSIPRIKLVRAFFIVAIAVFLYAF